MKFEIGDRVTLKKGLYLIENSNPLDIEGTYLNYMKTAHIIQLRE